MISQPLISIVVSSRNRPKKIDHCLKSILASFLSDFEIIVIDQSDDDQTEKIVKKLPTSPIKYFRKRKKGLGKGRNLGVKKSQGKIVAFTDDDCLVDKNWLKNIYRSFKENKDIIGVFGKVLPYQPERHIGKICPCTFLNNKRKIISKPCSHGLNIGFGNNMAFRREVFEKVGNFKEWLGPGSIGSNGEDAEFALRLLSKGYKLWYDSKVKVYHNRWLTKGEFRRQQLSYFCGEVACYGYFAFQGKRFAKKVVTDNFKDSYWRLRKTFRKVLSLKKGSFRLFFYALEKLYFRLRGLLIGWYFSKKEPL